MVNMKLGKYTEPNPDYGDVMSVEKFLEAVKGGWFIDYDGYGNASNGTHLDDTVNIYPSMVDMIPSDASHIVWFNR